MRRAIPYLVLAALCGGLFFWNLGSTPLIGLDEALYAESAREMAASGNYIVPTYNGERFFDKPPLAYWLQAGCIKLLGVGSLAVRLPSAVSAILLVALTVFLGTRLYSRRTGLLAGFALASAVYTLPLARLCSLDQLFALTITAALGSFVLTHTGIWPRWGYVGFWAAVGVSTMVKGPAGAVLIFAVIVAYLLTRRLFATPPPGRSHSTPPLPGEGSGERSIAPHVIGILLAVAIAAPWYVLVQRESGGSFLREFIIHQNLQRAMGKDFHHNAGLWFYPVLYLAGFFPWSVFVPSAWLRHVKLRPSDKTESASLFAALWVVVVIAVFSAAKSKLPSYIYPAYPPSALLVALLWSEAMEKQSGRLLRREMIPALTVAVILAAALIAAPSFLPKPIPGLSTALIPMAVFLIVGYTVAAVMVGKSRYSAAFAALCCGMAGFMLSAALIGLPVASRSMADQSPMLAREVKRLTSPRDTVIAHSLSPRVPSLPFYAERPVVMTYEPNEVKQAIRSAPECVVVTQQDRRNELPGGAKTLWSKGSYVIIRFGAGGPR